MVIPKANFQHSSRKTLTGPCKGLFSKSLPLAALSLLLFATLSAQVPSFQVDEIGFRQSNVPGVVEFFPKFHGVACTPDQLRHHLYEWEFSPTDFSVEATPQRSFFTLTPVTVKLRVGGIKEDIDPDHTPAGLPDPDPTNNIFRELPPALWGSQNIQPLVFTPTSTAQQPTTILKPQMRVLTPAHAPVPGENYPYLVQLENNSNCVFNVSLSLRFKVNGVGIPLVRTHAATGINCNPGNQQCDAIKLSLPARQRIVIPFSASIPVGDERIGESVTLRTVGLFDLSSGAECTKSGDSLFVSHRISRSVDPGSKWCVNGDQHFPGDKVLFRVQFHNAGNQSTHHIVVMDTLDPRLLIAEAEPVDVFVNGQEIFTQGTGTGSFYKFSKTVAARALQFQITLDSTSGLDADQLGTVTFQVPIDPNVHAEPGDEVVVVGRDSCLRFLRIPNQAYTLFEEEGRRYAAQCIPALKVGLRNPNCGETSPPSCCCPVWAWVVIAALVLLILLLLAFYRRGYRRA